MKETSIKLSGAQVPEISAPTLILSTLLILIIVGDIFLLVVVKKNGYRWADLTVHSGEKVPNETTISCIYILISSEALKILYFFLIELSFRLGLDFKLSLISALPTVVLLLVIVAVFLELNSWIKISAHLTASVQLLGPKGLQILKDNYLF